VPLIMSTFKTQIEDMIGSVGDDTFLSDALTDGAKELINLLPVNKLWTVSSDLTDSGSGIAVANSRVLYAHKSGYPARLVSPAMQGLLKDSASIHLATTKSPAYYLENGKAYVIDAASPTGGTVVAVSYPTVASSDSSIASFPDDFEYVVKLYAAIQGRIRQLSDKLSELPSDPIGMVVPISPSAPTLDTSISNDVSNFVYSSQASDLPSDLTMPTLDTAPTITDLSISDSTSVSVPSAPSITASNVSVSSMTADAIGTLGTAPSYVTPSFTAPTFPTITDLDLSTNNANITAPTSLAAPSFTDAQSSQAGSNLPSYTSPTMVLDEIPDAGSISTAGDQIDVSKWFDIAGDYIQTEEDEELAAAHLQKMAMYFQQYKLALDEKIASWNDSVEEYRGRLQEALANEQLQLSSDNQEYAAKLQRHATELNEYQAQVNAEYQEWVQNEVVNKIDKWKVEYANAIQKYIADINNNTQAFNAANAAYQANLQKLIVNSQQAQAAAAQNAQLTTDASAKDAANTLSADIQDYTLQLQRLSADVARHQVEVNKEVQVYVTNEIQKEIALWQMDQQQQLELTSVTIQNYQARTAVTNAKMQDALNSLNLAVQKHTSELNEAISLNRSKIEKYTADIQDYSAKASAMAQQTGLELQKYGSIYQKVFAEYNALLAGLQDLRGQYKQSLELLIGAKA